MLIIEVDKSGGIEKALKKLKRKFEKTGVVKNLRKRKEFKKKSELKREKVKKAIYITKKFNSE
jgi:small subunit ribosomal protein S21